MSTSHDQSRPTHSIAVVFFPLAGLCVLLALYLPVLNYHTPGWEIATDAALRSPSSLLRLVTTRDLQSFARDLPMLLATFANLTLVLTIFVGWRLHRKHASPMFWLAVNGMLAGLAVPVVAILTQGDRIFSHTFWQPRIGFWCWIAALVFVMTGWWSVTWHQRESQREFLESIRPDPPN